MATKHWIVGFDAREMWFYDFERMNVREHGATGYLRDGITKPLTVDSSIWSCIFNDGHYPHLSNRRRTELGMGTVKLPEWIGDNRPLWRNLEELENYISKHDHVIAKPYWIISITGLLEDLEHKSSREEWPRFEPTKPGSRKEAWRLVGYDINSRYNECCLTGTCFEGDEEHIRSLQNRWGPYLNEYHLFMDIEQAIEFRDLQNREHTNDAPHFVYGIWLIKDVKR
ncbi:MAG: hypothetical protein ACYST6_15145 [Planctomycetota bacterium]|jgi:hypothetical protein